ncbi:sensor histidine kinase [Oceanobacillus sp. CAU 1775]
MKLFKPITKLMRNLNSRFKFSFIGIILGIPIVLMTLGVTLDLNEDIKIIENRELGIQYNILLNDLLQETQQLRGLSSIMLASDSEESFQIEEKQQTISSQLNRIKQYGLEVEEKLQTAALYEELEKQWDISRKNVANLELHEALVAYDLFIEYIIDFKRKITDQSGLILSDNEVAYYLTTNNNHLLPSLTEDLGKIRSARALLENENREQYFNRVLYLINSARGYVSEVEHGHQVIVATDFLLENDFLRISEKVLSETEEFLNYVEYQISENQKLMSLEEDYSYVTTTIDSIFALLDFEIMTLQDFMNERKQELLQTRVLVNSLIVIGFILTIYCFIGFYLSIRESIAEARTEGLSFFNHFIFSQLQKTEKKYVKTQKQLNETEQKMSKLVLEAQEEERKGVARELHDSIGQYLYSILINLKVLHQQESEINQKVTIENVMKITEQAMKEVKGMAKALRPGILDDLGLMPALKSYIEEFEQIYGGIKVVYTFSGDKERLSPEQETNLYRICQEALFNTAKHSNASRINLHIDVSNSNILLKINDNGEGFLLEDEVASSKQAGIGLFSMRERVELLSGEFNINSVKGKGTNIEIDIPRFNE